MKTTKPTTFGSALIALAFGVFGSIGCKSDPPGDDSDAGTPGSTAGGGGVGGSEESGGVGGTASGGGPSSAGTASAAGSGMGGTGGSEVDGGSATDSGIPGEDAAVGGESNAGGSDAHDGGTGGAPAITIPGYKSGIAVRGSTSDGEFLTIFLMPFDDACDVLSEFASNGDNIANVVRLGFILLEATESELQLGVDYPAGAGNAGDGAPRYGFVHENTCNAECSCPDNQGSTGFVRLDELTAISASGSVDVVLEDGTTVVGSFDVEFCSTYTGEFWGWESTDVCREP